MSKKITHEQARQHLENKIKDGNILTVLEYIKQQEQTPLIHFDDANHFRNTFYNAPIGTVENEIANKLEKLVGLDNELSRVMIIANKLEKLVGLDNELSRVMIIANNRLERLDGLKLEFDKQTKLLELYKKLVYYYGIDEFFNKFTNTQLKEFYKKQIKELEKEKENEKSMRSVWK